MTLTESTVREFVDVLSSSSPAPGGGSVAALSGSLGAGLTAMVCRLTIGKKGYEEHEPLMKSNVEKADRLAQELLADVQKDTEAFNAVMAAFAMPKATDVEKEARASAIQKGYKEAIASPENIAVKCLKVLEIADAVAGKCNTNAMSDIAVGALEAWAGLQGAVLNMKINLPSIKDEEYVGKKKKWIDEIMKEGLRLSETIKKTVSEKI